jgi:hypothetical protein
LAASNGCTQLPAHYAIPRKGINQVVPHHTVSIDGRLLFILSRTVPMQLEGGVGGSVEVRSVPVLNADWLKYGIDSLLEKWDRVFPDHVSTQQHAKNILDILVDSSMQPAAPERQQLFLDRFFADFQHLRLLCQISQAAIDELAKREEGKNAEELKAWSDDAHLNREERGNLLPKLNRFKNKIHDLQGIIRELKEPVAGKVDKEWGSCHEKCQSSA